MNFQSVLTLLGAITASLILIIGIVLLTGLFLPGQVPGNYRYTLGGVMTAYALYRIGMTVARHRRRGDDDDSADEGA
ncbi:MAG TPA: hypothetical protein VI932_01395 [Bacteroidota bacterium]|nr:hypothetical protein [Bacteroidota bacterium]